MKNLLAISLMIIMTYPSFGQEISFEDVALNETFTTVNQEDISFMKILDSHKGKTIFLKIWASWCKDCLADLPNVEGLEKTYKNVAFVNLSHDRSFKSWKNGMRKYHITGDNYLLKKKWKESDFCKNIKLDWIPRYMVISPQGKILLFKAIKANNPEIIDLLNKTI